MENHVFSIQSIELPLKYPWKLSRNTTTHKTNCIIKCESEKHSGLGEVAPNIRYAETPESVLKEFSGLVFPDLRDVLPAELDQWLENQPISKALSFGISAAFADYFRSSKKQNWSEYLRLEIPEKVPTCYTIPVMEPGEIAGFIDSLKLNRFPYLKVKVNAEAAYDLIEQTLKHSEQKPLMVDGNEAWKDPDLLIRFVEKVRQKPILFLEQAMPEMMKEEMLYLKKYVPFTLMADESLSGETDWSFLTKAFSAVNMKFMKAGTLTNGRKILAEARKYEMKTMVGCMVETTLGMSFAYRMASCADWMDLDGFMVIKEEPYKLLYEAEGNIKETNA